MPRFQLLVREPGKEPRVVSLGDPFVVGRSRNADLSVDDEEVGRKQFRIGVTSGFVVLESLGTTNPTQVEEATIAAGDRTTLALGTTIRVGKTTFEVQSADPTEGAVGNPGEVIERTMVAPGPVSPRPAPPPPAAPPAALAPAVPPAPPADDQPMNTMELKRPAPAGPGPRAPTPPAGPAPGTQMFRPGAIPPPPEPSAGNPSAGNPSAGNPSTFEQTAAGGPPRPGNTPAAEGHEQTMQLGPGGFRPGGATPTPAASPTPPVPKPAPPPPAPLAAAPLPTPATPPRDKPKTVAMRPEDLAPAPTTAMLGNEGESRLHSSVPRLFVKSEGLKRRVRLMKASNRVGRAENADVLLPHESVSELHAEISFDGEQWSLQDMGSTNGTIVDGNHLRRTSGPLRRNSLIGVGALHVIFLCVDQKTAAQDRRDEQRALGLMVRAGRLTKAEANQIRRLCRADLSQSIAETLMMETTLKPIDWANAVATARSKVPLWDRLLGIFFRR